MWLHFNPHISLPWWNPLLQSLFLSPQLNAQVLNKLISRIFLLVARLQKKLPSSPILIVLIARIPKCIDVSLAQEKSRIGDAAKIAKVVFCKISNLISTAFRQTFREEAQIRYRITNLNCCGIIDEHSRFISYKTLSNGFLCSLKPTIDVQSEITVLILVEAGISRGARGISNKRKRKDSVALALLIRETIWISSAPNEMIATNRYKMQRYVCKCSHYSRRVQRDHFFVFMKWNIPLSWDFIEMYVQILF